MKGRAEAGLTALNHAVVSNKLIILVRFNLRRCIVPVTMLKITFPWTYTWRSKNSNFMNKRNYE